MNTAHAHGTPAPGSLALWRTTPHLSASGLRDYIDCSLQYRFSRIEKRTPEFVSSALILGSAVHKSVEAVNLQRQEGLVIDPSETESAFSAILTDIVKGYEARGVPIRFKDKETPESLLDQGKALTRLYAENTIQEMNTSALRVLFAELPFMIEVPGVAVPVIGAMDLLLEDASSGGLVLCEVKTTAKSYGAGEVDGTDQTTIYQMALRQLGYGDREVELRIDTLVKTKVPKFESHYTARTELDEARLKRKLRETWRGISSGLFVPSDGNWRCAACGFKQACAEWSLELNEAAAA